jgi:hypothetical protein
MPNPSTPETPGSITNLPLLGMREAVFLHGTEASVTLSPGGLLCAIRITGNMTDNQYRLPDVDFEITDYNTTALYDTMHKPGEDWIPYNTEDILWILTEPLINTNARDLYVLRWKSKTEFAVKTITTYHRLVYF